VCAEIESELRKLINPETGRPAVADVLNLRELYPDEQLGDFPDQIVIWANDAPIASLTSARVGTVSGEFPERRSGAHRNNCFLISNETLKRRTGDSAEPNLIDIAPTIYELMSVERPDYFDGRALLG
jgi:predicted AlkP superfamily phosphohydrolase/phosphomutase